MFAYFESKETWSTSPCDAIKGNHVSSLQMLFMNSQDAFSPGCLPNHAEGTAELQLVQEAVKQMVGLAVSGTSVVCFIVC